jgi:tRNA threonylcarbamoyladenosine biosynthesis protein TsaB
MSYILLIDTAEQQAQVILAKEDAVVGAAQNEQMTNHAAFVQTAIANLLQQAGISPKDLAAVAVTEGPGSYTGLRVGMASAKGLCYALQIPLITIGTLELMTASAIEQHRQPAEEYWYCPMIDARRMEVFTAIFDNQLHTVEEAQPMILDMQSFAEKLLQQKTVFFGSGAAKWQAVCNHENAFFESFNISPGCFARLGFNKFMTQTFADVAYAEPQYLKPFFSTQKRQGE